MKIIGISVCTTNQNGQAIQDIGNLWQRFFSEQLLAKIPNKVSDAITASTPITKRTIPSLTLV